MFYIGQITGIRKVNQAVDIATKSSCRYKCSSKPGSKPRSAQKGKTTAREWGVRRCSREIAKVLLANGANIQMKDLEGNTALIKASYNEHFKIAKLLIDNGAVVNYKNNFQESPLNWAELNGDLQMVRLLLNNGADPYAKNVCGSTALMNLCLHYPYLEIAKLLVDHEEIHREKPSSKW